MPTNYVTQISKGNGTPYKLMDEDARTAISSEATARANADSTLQGNIDAEATARATAVSNEATARETAVSNEATARETAISEEANARIADKTLLKTGCIASEYLDYSFARFVDNSNASGDYLDVNTFPINRSVLCSNVTSTKISHLPITPFTGYITTVCYQGNKGSGNNNRQFTIQMAQTVQSGNRLFIRAKYADWEEWHEIEAEYNNYGMKLVEFVGTNESIVGTQYVDCNTLTPGTVVLYSACSDVQHAPTTPFTGYITTIHYRGYGDGTTNRQFTVQYAQSCGSGENGFFVRAKYSEWSGWLDVSKMTLNALKAYPEYFSESNVSSFPNYEDCDTIPPMITAMYYNCTDSAVAHLPVSPFTGYITCINYHGTDGAGTGGVVNRDFSCQYAHTCGNDGKNDIYYRCKYSSWSAWKKINSDGLVINAYRGLKNFTVLGDSISVSLSYPTITPAYPVKSWATIMADSMNATAEIYAQGGMTTGGMLVKSDYPDAVANANDNQFAVIALGVNDSNSEVSSETFQINYAQLINDMLSNHKFVFCCTIPAGIKGDARAQYNADIKTVANSITGAFVVDVDKYSEQIAPLCHLGHMSSVGYAALASFIEKAIDDTIASNAYFYEGGIDQ